jgi:demethylmenaquinone methyltransferase/2-methoxy-6-polyprenyl-1,4-benzoquinol methylase/ArsR family transcriptional regulator
MADWAVGVDQSPAMLNVARTRLERAGLRNAQLRQGDIYALPVERDHYDLVVIHRVLHYLDDPARAIREAARATRPGGRVIVVDFAPHGHEFLREQHAHRRLGFSAQEIADFLREADLDMVEHRDLRPTRGEPERLTVSIWVGRDRRILGDATPITHAEIA